MPKNSNILKRLCGLGAVFFALVFWSPLTARAATLYLSPASATYHVGESFQVVVYISTPDQAMNASQASITFPTDILDVISVSTKFSIFSLLVENPNISAGEASFSGIVLNPGYIGSRGKLVTINFAAKAEGKATLHVINGQVLANDGEGTDILTGTGGATLTIIPKEETPVPKKTTPPVKPPTQLPATPPSELIFTTASTTGAGEQISTTTTSTAPAGAALPAVTQTQKLPYVLIKIGGFVLDSYALWLILLFVLIFISATTTVYSFLESLILQHRLKRAYRHHKKHHFYH